MLPKRTGEEENVAWAVKPATAEAARMDNAWVARVLSSAKVFE
jgi:hypothetical protein